MARADIADYLGLTTETVSRMISRFKVEGVIQLRQNAYVKVRDVDRLRELAEESQRATAPPGTATRTLNGSTGRSPKRMGVFR